MNKVLEQTRLLFIMGVIALVFALPPRLSAECLGMYAYSDVWADENGNVLSLNQTSLDSSCVDYAAFADIGMSLPGDYTHYESATGGVNAEDLRLVRWFKQAKKGPLREPTERSPHAAPACSNTTNPMCVPVAMIGGVDQPCAVAWSINYLTYSINGGPWQCFQAWANQVHFTAPAFCTPRV